MNPFTKWGHTRRLSHPQPLAWSVQEEHRLLGTGADTTAALSSATSACDFARSGAIAPRADLASAQDELTQLLAPATNLLRLTAYRYDEDPRYRERLDEALALWLASALAAGAGAELRLTLNAAGIRVAFAPAETLTALIPEGSWEHDDSAGEDVSEHGACASIVNGEPCRTPWNALAAWHPRFGTVRVRVRTLPTDGNAAADRLAALAAADAWFERAHRTKTLGNETSTLRDPVASAWQARLAQERAHVADADGMCRLAVLVEARDPRDLDHVCALLLGAMATGAGTPIPQRVDLAASATGQLAVPAGWQGALTQVAPLSCIARLLEPPTEPARGLTVVNASVGPSARQSFATSGTTPAADGPRVSVGTFATGIPCTIPLARLAQHVVITGMPGMRKTTCSAHLVRQLMAAGVHVVVLEPSKCEYQRLIAGAAPLVVHGAGGNTAQLAINPLAVDPGVRPGLWLQTLASCMVSALGMQEAPLPLYLEGLLRRLYRTRGIDLQAPATSRMRWPTIADLLAEVNPYVDEECPASPDIRANVRAALTLRVRTLADQPAFQAATGLRANDLTARNRVLRLADLGEEAGAFAGMVLLARIAQTALRSGQHKLHTVFVLEEAHALLEDAQTGESTRFARLYTQLLAEARAAGIGFITIDQRPALLPEGVLANSVTRIAFASAHDRDRAAVSRSLGLTPFQEQRLGSLPPGEAIFATAGSAGPDRITLDSTHR